MNVSVVDCSALASVVFDEPDGDAIRAQIRNRVIIAPALLPFELAQVCTTKVMRHAEQGDLLIDQYTTAMTRLPIEIAPVNFEELPRLASKFGLSAYDSAYLWLALARRVPLVTLDRKLAAAMRAAR